MYQVRIQISWKKSFWNADSMQGCGVGYGRGSETFQACTLFSNNRVWEVNQNMDVNCHERIKVMKIQGYEVVKEQSISGGKKERNECDKNWRENEESGHWLDVVTVRTLPRIYWIHSTSQVTLLSEWLHQALPSSQDFLDYSGQIQQFNKGCLLPLWALGAIQNWPGQDNSYFTNLSYSLPVGSFWERICSYFYILSVLPSAWCVIDNCFLSWTWR